MGKIVTLLFAVFLIIPSVRVAASWTDPFVTYSDGVYTVTEELVEEQLLDHQIGKVTLHSPEEGNYSGNFSNSYPKGTAYYSIKGTSKNKEIAIKADDHTFFKATFDHSNGAAAKVSGHIPWTLVIMGGATVLLLYFFRKKKRHELRRI
ncbi:hypothetical protein J2Z69_003869 [Paenibacillus shirakamiensis]|uniref:Gram-positive cocci surface proteins LPxTG domain-containing protein n=1 Tax=Paenibacillus shirakamiensis TaxID=1265935 RepID=A0ABS4JM35_9BACL|nr:hypothetical protein [Paenibacillus shirakamiensis]MBP2002758.1 hypothetical protein [Paenibacillus shirakamiensis]